MQLQKWIGKVQWTFVLAAAAFGCAAHAWEPTKPIEFVVPAGTGGGADQMARFIQGAVAKNKLSPQPINWPLYTSDAPDEQRSGKLGGSRILNKRNTTIIST